MFTATVMVSSTQNLSFGHPSPSSDHEEQPCIKAAALSPVSGSVTWPFCIFIPHLYYKRGYAITSLQSANEIC